MHAETWGWLLTSGQKAYAQLDHRLAQTSASFSFLPALPLEPADSPKPPQSCREPVDPLVGRDGGQGMFPGTLVQSPLSHPLSPEGLMPALPWSPLRTLSLLWINLPKVNGRKEGGETEMMMTLIFPSAGAWGGWLFCFLDLSREFSARQSSRHFHCFLILC